MAAILDFKMAAIQKPIFDYNLRTKHDRKENSTVIFKLRISEFKKLFSKFHDGGHLGFQNGGHSKT